MQLLSGNFQGTCCFVVVVQGVCEGPQGTPGLGVHDELTRQTQKPYNSLGTSLGPRPPHGEFCGGGYDGEGEFKPTPCSGKLTKV